MELLLKLFWLHYGNTAFGVSSLGIQNWQGFSLRMNVIKGNFSIV